MTFLELAQKRFSCRDYSSQPVMPDKIMRCLEAARLAPSACNAQPWHFLVINEETKRQAIAAQTKLPFTRMNRFAPQAPTLVLVLAEKPNLTSQVGSYLKNKEYTLLDIGIAAEHFCLQATEEGLGTCILGWFDEKTIQQIAGLPPAKRIALIITVGYPARGAKGFKKRKPLNKMVSFNTYEGA
jgi:nitroreductase